MYYIRNFSSDKNNLPLIYSWIDDIDLDNSVVSELQLKLIINEGFVNACHVSKNKYERINIIVNKINKSAIEILVTDVGKGFCVDNLYGDFPKESFGKTVKLFSHPLEELQTTIINKNCIEFTIAKNKNDAVELLEKHRGLLSILKLAKKVEYHYSQVSLNHLYILLQK